MFFEFILGIFVGVPHGFIVVVLSKSHWSENMEHPNNIRYLVWLSWYYIIYCRHMGCRKEGCQGETTSCSWEKNKETIFINLLQCCAMFALSKFRGFLHCFQWTNAGLMVVISGNFTWHLWGLPTQIGMFCGIVFQLPKTVPTVPTVTEGLLEIKQQWYCWKTGLLQIKSTWIFPTVPLWTSAALRWIIPI